MIDTHIHLYDTTRKEGVPWPPKEDKVLYKPHLPAEFKKALNMNTTSQENALAGTGGGAPIIVNNNNVDNSVQSSQTTAVSMPAPTRSNESTLRALQMT